MGHQSNRASAWIWLTAVTSVVLNMVLLGSPQSSGRLPAMDIPMHKISAVGNSSDLVSGALSLARSVIPTNHNWSSAVVIPANGLPPGTPREDYSRVTYKACCGLGHRLLRMSNAYHVAKKLSFELKSDWGSCGVEGSPDGDIFNYLFQPQPLDELAYVNSTHKRLFYGNEVPGYSSAGVPWEGDCRVRQDKVETDLEMYTSLRNRFRERGKVDSFVQQHFAGRTVLGLYTRAKHNGELGNEKHQETTAADEQWVSNIVTNILLQLESARQNATFAPPVLYLSTDTPRHMELLSRRLKGIMPVVALSKDISKQDDFIQHSSNKDQQQQRAEAYQAACLQNKNITVFDMILLSHSDVLIAAKPSSFTQSLPLSLVFGRSPRKLDPAFCEVKSKTQELKCFRSYVEWGCDTTVHTRRYQVLPFFLQNDGFAKAVAQLQPPDRAKAIQASYAEVPHIDVKNMDIEKLTAMVDARESNLRERQAYLKAKEMYLNVRIQDADQARSNNIRVSAAT